MAGVLVISLDAELGYGGKEPSFLELLGRDGSAGRRTYSRLISVLSNHRMPATWAFVGRLFDGEGGSLNSAPDLVEQVIADPAGHEIGYHSYSHPDFARISQEEAKAELAEAARLRKEWNIPLDTFVYPYNHIAHLPLLASCGFFIYRGETRQRWRPEPGGGSSRDHIADKVVARQVVPTLEGGIWELPASMHFSDPHLPVSLLPRAMLSLRLAARQDGVLHIWLHPWDLASQPRLAADLDRFLASAASLRERGSISVETMGGLCRRLSEGER
jgi:peptidoglycan/xylan/chitin deacetylase (PgdA/CDA1 family)